jgi:hypothetical protein
LSLLRFKKAVFLAKKIQKPMKANHILAIISCLSFVLLFSGCSTPVQPASADVPPIISKHQLAKGKRMIANHVAAPVDLTARYTTPVSWFDHITNFPAWKTVPRGFQVFANVPLQIDGMICLWGEGNATKLHIVFPEQILGIEVGQKFETLYVYHGAFFPSPDGTPVCEVVLRYEDGSSVTNQMRYGNDVLDWLPNTNQPVIGPTGPNSTLAWVGGTFTPNKHRPLRLCLTAIANPQPSLEVKTIDLYSCKSRTAPCIMAMTTGRSGLLKRRY